MDYEETSKSDLKNVRAKLDNEILDDAKKEGSEEGRIFE